MLRIHHNKITPHEAKLTVEGELLGPWVEELRSICEPFMGSGRKLTVDLSAVLFADRGGVGLLQYLSSQGVRLECSPFLAEMLSGREATPSENEGQP